MAANATKDDYVFSTFKLTAEIEGFGTIEDVVAISGTFALNTIPKASLTLAAGVNATTGQPASAHRILANVKMRAKVTVRLEVETTDGKVSQSPAQKIKVFEGYYAGFGFQRAQDNAQYTLHLVHWLDDLNTASMLSRNFFPSAPYAIGESANGWSLVPASGFAMPVPSLDPKNEFVNTGKIESDMWGQTLRPLLEKLAKFPSPGETGCNGNNPDEEQTPDNNAVLKSLSKINGGPNPAKLPLALRDLSGAVTVNDVNRAVENGLAQSSLEGYNYSTIWSVLIGLWGPSFFFACSPSVDFANFFPYFAGLQFDEGDKNFKTIKADDYGYAKFMCNTGTILEGVNIFWGQQSNTGFALGGLKPMRLTSFCLPLGKFPKNEGDRDKRGAVLVKEPPNWITNVVTFTPHTVEAVGIGGQNVGEANNGMQHGNEKRGDGGPDRAEGQDGLKNSAIADRFAEHWYKQEFLQQRYGELSGKLRFDIAPGSMVKIEMPKKAMPELADTQTDMIGMVAQVSFVINAELANAGTSFSITNLRSAQEDKDPLKTSPKPPLYNDKWAGGPLATPES